MFDGITNSLSIDESLRVSKIEQATSSSVVSNKSERDISIRDSNIIDKDDSKYYKSKSMKASSIVIKLD